MRHIVELRDGGMPDFWSSKSVLALNLRRKVSQNNDSRLLWTQKQRADEEIC
jgi:hypothetical protein